MAKFIRITCGLAALFAGLLPLSAGDRDERAPRHHHQRDISDERMDRLTARLGLTDHQRERVENILRESLLRQRELFAQARDNTDRRERMRLMRALQKGDRKTQSALAEVLTAEQMKSYDEMTAELRERLRERMRDRAASDRPARRQR